MSGDPRNNQFIFKVILIGDSSTGKTSMIQRFINNTFEDKHLNTIGVDFFMRACDIEKHHIKLQIWDTAGTEKYRSISSSYYRGSHAAFIVFDLTCRNTFENVRNWVDSFRKNCNPQNKNNIILIGNKSDLTVERQVKQEEAEELAQTNEMIYWETSAKSGQNVEEVFSYVTKLLYDFYKKDNFSFFQVKTDNNENYKSLINEDKKGICC